MTATASSTPTVQRPTSVDEAVKVLRDSRGSVLFRGAGTKMSWAGRRRTRIWCWRPAAWTGCSTTTPPT